MKKLMIAMSAAAMAALCAQAGIPDGYTSGIDFEDTATGYLNVTAPDVKDGPVLWATTATLAEGGTVESTVVAESEDANANKFLKVDETVPLQRLMDTKPTSVGTGIEISSRVQFTAADEAQEPAPGDKILVWAKQIEDNPTTEAVETAVKLMVTALDENSATKHFDTGLTVETETWYDLVITALPDVGEDALSPVQFMVKLGNNDAVGPYTSLALAGDTGASTISSIGFQGTGAVDDIGFKTVTVGPEPNFLVGENAYATFEEALAAAVADSATGVKSIAVGQNVTLTVGEEGCGILIAKGQKVAIDLKGHKLAAPGLVIDNYGQLTITDSIGGGSVENTDKNAEELVSIWNESSYIGDGEEPVPTGATVTIAGGKYLGAVVADAEDLTVVGSDSAKKYELKLVDGYYVISEVGGEAEATYSVTIDAPAAGVTIEGAPTGKVTAGEIALTITANTGYKNLVVKVGDENIVGVNNVYTINVQADTTVTVTVEALATVNVTVNPAAGTTVSELAATATEGDTLTFTVTVANGYKADTLVVKNGETTLTPDTNGNYTIEVGTTDVVITTEVEKDQGGETLPTYLEGASEKAIAAYNTWAAANGVVDTASQYEEAFLLNCAPTAVATEKAAFKLSIKMVNGEAVVTTPEGKPYNGKVVIKSYKDVTCTVEGTGEKATFYKATLEVEKAAN